MLNNSTKNRGQYIIKALLLLSFIVEYNFAFPKSLNPGKPSGHQADIYSILPFKKCKQIDDLILNIHNGIDHPIGYFAGLRNPPHQDFTWHKYGHRVFFHWGFNSNPKNSIILNKLVDERKWPKNTQELFWEKVITEQSRRNKSDMALCSKTLSFSLQGKERAYANAIASLIVDVHILGDYTTTNIVCLQEISSVASDIKKALFSSLYGGDIAKEINKAIDKTASIKSQKERAVAILKILQQNMPTFWLEAQNSYFIKHFKKIGLPLKQLYK